MTPRSQRPERTDFQSDVHSLADKLESILLSLRDRQPRGDTAASSDESHLVVQSLQVVADRLTGLEKVATDIHQLLIGQRQEKEWYTTRELAEIVGKSDYTIRERWCNDGRIECMKDPATGKWRIPGSEVRRLRAGGSLLPRHGGDESRRLGKV
jgi:hypothetical protein